MTTTETQIFHVADKGDVAATVTYDADVPCACGCSAKAVGWRLVTTGRGFEVFRCPDCGEHLAIASR